MRSSQRLLLPLTAIVSLSAAAGLIGVAGAAVGAPAVTNVLATLPAGSQPRAIVLDASSNLYSLNGASSTISKIGPTGSLSSSWAALPATAAMRDLVTMPDGTLFTAASSLDAVSRVAPDGTVTLSYATLATGAEPRALALAADGAIYTANFGGDSVSKVDAMGVVTRRYASLAAAAEPFDIVRTAGGDLYTLNADLSVSHVSASGVVDEKFATLAAGGDPVNLAVSSTGHVFVLESGVDRIEEFDATGALARTIPLPSRGGQIAVDARDNLFVTLRSARSVGLLPAAGGALVPSIAPLTPGSDYSALAVTNTDVVYAAGLSDPAIVSRIALGADVTSTPVRGTAKTGVAFTATVTASGYEPVTFSLRGNVPPGLSINATTGVISGTPTRTGSFGFNVVASNIFGDSSEQGAGLIISAGPTPTPTPTATPTPTTTPPATSTPTSAPTPTHGSGPAGPVGSGGSRASGDPTSLAQTGSGYLLPAGLAVALGAAGVAGIIVRRRRRGA